MNMPVRDMDVDRAIHGPQNAIGRIREWAMVRHWDAPNSFPRSPFAKIAEMHEFAAARGSGAKYDMISTEEDPEVTPCRPDGGMGAFAERHDPQIRYHLRARETAYAIAGLPADLRQVLLEMYAVPQRERPKSDRVVSEALGLPRLEIIKRLERAYGWIGKELGLPPI